MLENYDEPWKTTRQHASAASSLGWFYHNPYDGNGVWWPELPTYPVEPDSLESLRKAGIG